MTVSSVSGPGPGGPGGAESGAPVDVASPTPGSWFSFSVPVCVWADPLEAPLPQVLFIIPFLTNFQESS